MSPARTGAAPTVEARSTLGHPCDYLCGMQETFLCRPLGGPWWPVVAPVMTPWGPRGGPVAATIFRSRLVYNPHAMTKTPITFYFDFSSPYSYIASEWIEALAARHGRTVHWRALLLGVTLAAAELRSPVSYPIKRDYAFRDFGRSARFESVPYAVPDVFPISTQNAARVFWWLRDTQNEQAAAAWARAGLRAYFTRGVRLDDPQALAALAAESGLDSEAATAVWNDPQWKQRLKDEVAAAVAAGVFGAPTFIVDGEMFWGNDRKAQIARWLESGPF
jgi:2-hydroxychromene-2-carboxylate isomerase